jgi:hypothetical protein
MEDGGAEWLRVGAMEAWSDGAKAILQLLFSFLAVMEAHGSVDIVVAFGGEEKKLDAA